METIYINQHTGYLPICRQFDCAYCGRSVVVNTRQDKRYKYCSKQCEKQFWREVTKGKRCTNLRTFSTGQMKRKLALEQHENRHY